MAEARKDFRAMIQSDVRQPLERSVDALRQQSDTALGLGLAKLGKLAKFCKFLAGSFSAV